MVDDKSILFFIQSLVNFCGHLTVNLIETLLVWVSKLGLHFTKNLDDKLTCCSRNRTIFNALSCKIIHHECQLLSFSSSEILYSVLENVSNMDMLFLISIP